ncbi:helix-turn-helix transcriptional regulator [Streptomyces sp. NBC_01353]|uniref:helix-turn-helix transcriptional regulator n=1 Tax=Streptomyces sp. NBC_01353 TaxID=2903835 RepID=UPI002E318100|nr:AraC family transcriptional regulator [Streptomyces sp. NBC_01353]
MCHPAWSRARTAAQRLSDFTHLRRVRDRIDREYARPLNVENLARDANMPAGDLSRQFRLAYGGSPYTYLMTRRIERATVLLRRGDLGVAEVCFAVGCSSLATFSTHFTELVGMEPDEYRRRAAMGPVGTGPLGTAPLGTRPLGTGPLGTGPLGTGPVRNREALPREPELA